MALKTTVKAVRAVFFDAAHTVLQLARPYPEMLSSAIRKFGYEAPSEEIEEKLPARWEKVAHLFNGISDDYSVSDEWDRRLWCGFYELLLADLGVRDYPDELLDEVYHQFSIPENWVVYDDVFDVLDDLKAKGMKLGIGSNWDSRLPGILEGLGLAQYMDAIVVSAVVGCRKPGGKFFEAECRAVGLGSNEIMHVGDHPVADIQGALDAGVQTALIWRFDSPAPQVDGVKIMRSLKALREIPSVSPWM